MLIKDQIEKLFVLTNDSRAILSKVSSVAEDIKQVGMNSAVSACHTGKSLRAFSEISREIDRSAKRILLLSNEMISEVDHFLRLTLQAVRASADIAYYIEALGRIASNHNRSLIEHCISALNQDVNISLKALNTRSYKALALCNTLAQTQQRIFALANTIKIEAIFIESENEQTTFNRLAEELEASELSELTQELRAHLQAIGKTSGRTSTSVSPMTGENGYATRQAV